jgi:hypothetical protein
MQLRPACVAVTGPAFCEAANSLPASSVQVLAAEHTEVRRHNHGPYNSRGRHSRVVLIALGLCMRRAWCNCYSPSFAAETWCARRQRHAAALLSSLRVTYPSSQGWLLSASRSAG